MRLGYLKTIMEFQLRNYTVNSEFNFMDGGYSSYLDNIRNNVY